MIPHDPSDPITAWLVAIFAVAALWGLICWVVLYGWS